MATNQNKVGIIGAGVMGIGIAQLILQYQPVCLIEENSSSLPEEAIITRLKNNFIRMINKKLIDHKQMDLYLSRLEVSYRLESLADCSMVIEAVPEELKLKRRILSQAETLVSSNALIATNTSTLSITAIASALKRPERLVGVHFFNPPAVMKLVEIVRGLQTASAVIEHAVKLAISWGKTVVHSRSTPGFIVNRIARPYYCETLSLFDERCATPDSLDAILEGSGLFPMGTFTLIDLIGLDTNYRNTLELFRSYHHDRRYLPSLSQLEYVHANRLGRKTGIGFYSYDSGKAIRKPDDHPMPPHSTITTQEPIKLYGTASWLIELNQELKKITRTEWNEKSDLDRIEISGITILPSTGELAAARKNREKITHPCAFIDLIVDLSMLKTLAITTCQSTPEQKDIIASLFQAIGKKVIFIPDTPAMVVQRVVCLMINEALQAITQGVCNDTDCDLALQLGMNFKKPLLALAETLGYPYVYQVLTHLYSIYKDEKYRPSLELSRRIHLVKRRNH